MRVARLFTPRPHVRCESFDVLFASAAYFDGGRLDAWQHTAATMTEKADYEFSLLLIGESGVGKSGLLLRFADGKWIGRSRSSATSRGRARACMQLIEPDSDLD